MHLFIGVPTHSGSIEVECLASLFRLQDHLRVKRPEVRISLSWVVGQTVDRARNIIAARFMQDETASHLLFVDSDMGFEPSLIERFIDEDAPLVSTFCPSRHLSTETMMQTRVDNRTTDEFMSITAKYVAIGDIVHQNCSFDPSPSGFVQVLSIGTALMMIRRDVFDRIGEDSKLWSRPDDYKGVGVLGRVLQAFSPMQRSDGVWLGEDISFCKRWTDLNGKIFACVDETVTHVGRIAIKGKFRDHLDYFSKS